MLITTIADLPSQVGADLGMAEWIIVGQDRIDSFAHTTEDRQWIHVDPVRAAVGPFGAAIAHGYLTLSLASKFLLDLLVVSDAGRAVNYGLDRVRFPSPVPAGAAVRGRGELLDVRTLPDGVQTTIRITIERCGYDKPAAVADVLTRFLR